MLTSVPCLWLKVCHTTATKAALKQLIKKNGHTYADLARDARGRGITDESGMIALAQERGWDPADTKAAMRQMPQAQAIYDKMSPESRQRVDERVDVLRRHGRAELLAFHELAEAVALGHHHRQRGPQVVEDAGAEGKSCFGQVKMRTDGNVGV